MRNGVQCLECTETKLHLGLGNTWMTPVMFDANVFLKASLGNLWTNVFCGLNFTENANVKITALPALTPYSLVDFQLL